MAFPSRKDINVYDSLDEQSACEHFLGTSLCEAEALFRKNFIYYQEDLRWMGPVAFRFYIQAAINYIRSAAATGDSDIINCLASILEARLEHDVQELLPIAPLLASACDHILVHYDRFEYPTAFADVRPRFSALYHRFSTMSQPHK